MIRTLRPTDIVAYLAFHNRASENAALDFPGDNPHPVTVKTFLSRSLSLDPRRESWVEIQDRRINGLVGVKGRLGTDFWDIDQLIASPADAESIYVSLLRHLSRSACEEGVQKVFLRTKVDETPALAAKQAGFVQYAVERVYRLSTPALKPVTVGLQHLRSRRRSDHHAIFQLYCSAVPVSVRQIEGMTMQEWRWTEGWGLRPPGWRVSLPRARRDYVLERDDVLVAWLQVRPRIPALVLMLRPEDADEAERILRFGIEQLADAGPIYVPVRQYQLFMEPSLQKLGFELIAEHALLTKTLTIRVPELKVVAMRAHASR